MKALNQHTLQAFINLAGDRLNGEWVLIGGTILPLLGIDHRVTTDIDFIKITTSSTVDTLKLMELAEELELPIECINQAGALYLSRIPNYQNSLVLLHRGKSATIYRPDAFLYLVLKLKRLSETDLLDCIQWLNWATTSGELPETDKVLSAIKKDLKAKGISAGKKARLKKLMALVKKLQN